MDIHLVPLVTIVKDLGSATVLLTPNSNLFHQVFLINPWNRGAWAVMTISEMKCSACLLATIMNRYNVDNSRRFALSSPVGVHTYSSDVIARLNRSALENMILT